MKIIEALDEIQLSLCAYNSSTFCDCKFGANNIGSGSEKGNGCPEIRKIILMLEQANDLLAKSVQTVESNELAKQIRIWLDEYEKDI